MNLFSKIAPSSKSIQSDYIKKRQRALYANDPAKTERVQKKIEDLMQRKRCFGTDWYDAYLRIHARLQSASLTINFDAYKWFQNVNMYKTYAQTYERAATGGQLALKDDKFNPAITRAVVDDAVTLPEEWAHAHPFSERRRLYNALNVTGAVKGGNLQSAVQAAGVGAKVPKVQHVDPNDTDKGITTTNKYFKPRAKQVFAALNYGRRPHGSSTTYGFSHLILNPRLKLDALYYPEDTFNIGKLGTTSQATFNTIGAVIDRAGEFILDDIWSSCFVGHSLEDTDEPIKLLEAHVFKNVKVNQDVEALVLSRSNDKGEQYSTEEWNTVMNNAHEWCKRNKVRLLFASP